MHGYDRASSVYANGITLERYWLILTDIRARYWFLYVKIIWICQCVIFSALCLVACLFLSFMLSCLLPRWAALRFLFLCFYRNRFCSPAINQISLGQSTCWFSFILLCRREKYHWTGSLGLYINHTNRISELHQLNYLNVKNIV